MTTQDVAAPIHGIVRLTRHPLFTAASLWAVAALAQRNRIIDMLFWAPVPIFSLIGCIHQDYKRKEELGSEFFEKTSFFPFGAMITGQQHVVDMIREMNLQALSFALTMIILVKSAKFLTRAYRVNRPRRNKNIMRTAEDRLLDIPGMGRFEKKPPTTPKPKQ
jgi:uncharacterized membrane protein